jgi:hypothetical protein
MKHIKTYSQLFETLKSYDMTSAKKVLTREFANLGITDFWISTDQDMKDRIGKDYELDKLIILVFGGKTGDVKNVIEQMDKVLYVFEKIGWFPALLNYEYGKWDPPAGPGGHGVGKKKGEIKDMKNIVLPKDTRYLHFVLDPYFDDEVQPEDRTFYHATKKENVERIMKQGLLPKSHSKRTYYPQRIFLANNLKGVEFILPQLKGEEKGEYVILKVTVPKNIGIFTDTRYKGYGVYILDPIGPENIELMEPSKLKQAA